MISSRELARNLDWLRGRGFEDAGSFMAVSDERISFTGSNSEEAAVYLFVADGEVKYVGRALGGLRRRMYGYSRPRATDADRPVHRLIRDALKVGPVSVMALFIPVVTDVHKGLPVHLPSGIEMGLIFELDPQWNRQGHAPRRDMTGRLMGRRS